MANELKSPDQQPASLLADFKPVSTDAWRDKIEEDLKGADYQKLVWTPLEGFPVEPFYRAEALENLPTFNFAETRPDDVQKTWLIRQNIRQHDIATTNEQARKALRQGVDAVGFDVTQAPGAAGLLIQDQTDLARLLEAISLADTPIHLIGPAGPGSLLSMLLELAAERGTAAASLKGSIPINPLAALLSEGNPNVAPSFDEAAQWCRDAEKAGTSLHTLVADARVFHEAGATAVQELAFLLATASEFLAELTDRNLAFSTILSRLRLRVPVGTSYFMEIAKLRALRVLFGQVVTAFDSNAPSDAYVEATTSRWSMTRYDEHVNMLRATTQAASAILGGCDELTVLPYDAASGLPSDFANRIARNTQLVLKHEAHLDAVIDPAAGSYYLETLTDQISRAAWALFQEVEQRGGLIASCRDGFIQQSLAAVRKQKEQDVATGRKALVGTNMYPDSTQSVLGKAGTHDQTYARPEATTSVIDRPSLPALPTGRGAEAFERLRLQTERHVKETGHQPTVFLVLFGHPALASARATFSRNFFGCAGYQIEESRRYDALDEGVAASLENDADIVVFCSSDPDYTALPSVLNDRKEERRGGSVYVVAGYPSDLIEPLMDAGVDTFIHRKQNLLDTLQTYHQRLGIDDA